jgi:hypothetical protein
MPYTHLTRFYAQAGFADLEPRHAPAFLSARLRASLQEGLSVCLMLKTAPDIAA